MGIKFILFINAFTTGFMFGLWQGSIFAGVFMFLAIGTCLSMIDYIKRN